jgi:hypothetical protein
MDKTHLRVCKFRQSKNSFRKKNTVTPDKQKTVRAKIRANGFYYSDFSSKRDGYTVAVFEVLIRSGEIKISDGNYKQTTNEIAKPNDKPRPVEMKVFALQESIGLKSILEIFKENRFDPKIDSEANIPKSSGNYILCLKKNTRLPTVSIKPVLINLEGLQVIYTGISRRSLRTRDFKQHFKGDNAGRSTLRKSLGVLFGYKQIPRDNDPNTGKTKFGRADELKLSEWMCDN